MADQRCRLALTGEMLRAARNICRLNQADLAAAAGLSLETIKRLERIRGVVNASSATLGALIAAFARHETTFVIASDGRSCVRKGPWCPDAPIMEPPPEPDRIYRVLYYSRATSRTLSGASQSMSEIETLSIERNGRLGITGSLVFTNGFFLQVLEGSRAAVSEVLASIAMDRRHENFCPVDRLETDRRLFTNWVLCSRIDTGNSDIDPAAMTPDEILQLLLRSSDEERRAVASARPLAQA